MSTRAPRINWYLVAVCAVVNTFVFNPLINLIPRSTRNTIMHMIRDLSLSSWLLLLLASLILCIVLPAYISPLRSVPGPFLAKFTRLWLAYHGHKGDLHSILLTLHRRHGSTIRIAPNELSTINPFNVRKIYSINSGFKKSEWYEPVHGTRKFDLFGGQDEEVHRRHRRLVNHTYSLVSLREVEKFMDGTIEKLVRKLRELTGQVIDLGLWLQLAAFGEFCNSSTRWYS
jgi:hypothetical protein